MSNITKEERFWKKVAITPSCWLWQASLSVHGGYGRFRIKNHIFYAHVVSYTWLVGEIPSDLELDHLCRIRHCVNPTHLEPVTHIENIRRGIQINQHTNKTHCINGHGFNKENTYWRLTGGRQCRACQRKISF